MLIVETESPMASAGTSAKRRLPKHELFHVERSLLAELDEKLRDKWSASIPTACLSSKPIETASRSFAPRHCRRVYAGIAMTTRVYRPWPLPPQVAAIVTGDQDLLTLQSYHGIPILSPRQ